MLCSARRRLGGESKGQRLAYGGRRTHRRRQLRAAACGIGGDAREAKRMRERGSEGSWAFKWAFFPFS